MFINHHIPVLRVLFDRSLTGINEHTYEWKYKTEILPLGVKEIINKI